MLLNEACNLVQSVADLCQVHNLRVRVLIIRVQVQVGVLSSLA